MADIKWGSPNSEETAIDTGLNSLADNGRAVSGTISNDGSGERYVYMTVEVSLAAQGSARDTGAFVEIYVLPSLDGSNFTYGSSSLDPPYSSHVGNVLFDDSTSARVSHLPPILIPPFDFQILVKNQTGQAFAASGSTVTIRRYNLATV